MTAKRERAYPILDHLASATGVLALLGRRLRSSVIVLMYHKVLPDRIADDCPHRKLVIRETTFAGQVAWLAKHTRVQPLREALATRESDLPTVSLTFDDGYRDNAEIAAPLLERAGLRATFFVSTDFIDGTPLWFDQAAFAHARLGAEKAGDLLRIEGEALDASRFLDHLKRLPAERRAAAVTELANRAPPLPDDLIYAAMRPDQLAELGDAGHEIASHGIRHEMLPDLGTEALTAELAGSSERIRAWTGEAPVGFCYPNGYSNPTVEAATAAAGYEYACSTTRGVHRPGRNLFRLRRRLISEKNTADVNGRHVDALFAGEVLGLHRIIRHALGRSSR